MRVTRIAKIKDQRVFRDFSWPDSLIDFGQFNLIYGWNGTGKTTLSNLFRSMETHSSIEGDVEFDLGGHKVAGSSFQTADLPVVRVFNRDIVGSSVFEDTSRLDPIYYLGQESVVKQLKIDDLRTKLRTAQQDLANAREYKDKSERALDAFCINEARTIKGYLTSGRMPEYNNFDKRSFREAIQLLDAGAAASALCSDAEKVGLRILKDAPSELRLRVSLLIQ